MPRPYVAIGTLSTARVGKSALHEVRGLDVAEDDMGPVLLTLDQHREYRIAWDEDAQRWVVYIR